MSSRLPSARTALAVGAAAGLAAAAAQALGGADGWVDAAPTSDVDVLVRTAARVLAPLLVALVATGAVGAVAALRAGSTRHRRWLVCSAVLLAANTAVLALTWPGYWVWDEYGVLASVRAGDYSAWQSILTPLYHLVCLELVPTAVGIPVLQVLLASAVLGWAAAWAAELSGRRWAAALVVVLGLSPVVLLNVVYPLRLTAYSLLELLVVVRLVVLGARPGLAAHPRAELVLLGAAVAVLATWRSEGVVWLLALPLLPVLLGLLRRPRLRPAPAVATLLALAVVAGLVLGAVDLTRRTTDAKYALTAVVNPLSVMLQQPLTGPRVTEDLTALDAALDLDLVRANPDATEVPSVWAGAVRPDAEEHLPAAQRAFADLVLQHPGAFLAARWQTLAATSALDPASVPQVRRAWAWTGRLREDEAAARAALQAHDPLTVPWDEDLRAATVRALLLLDGDGRLLPAAPLVWTPLPAVAGAALAAGGVLLAAVRRSARLAPVPAWLLAALLLVPLARAGLVFLTAPASYVMYYLPVQLTGGVLLVLTAALLLPRPGRRGARGGRARARRGGVPHPGATGDDVGGAAGQHPRGLDPASSPVRRPVTSR